jgi:sRNA-binding protein
MATLKLKKYTCAKDWLDYKYPDLFNRPMAIGIKKVLTKKKPKGVSSNSIRKLLIEVSQSEAYQYVILNNKNRYNLDGSIMGYVPKKHKDYAKERLRLIEKGDV